MVYDFFILKSQEWSLYLIDSLLHSFHKLRRRTKYISINIKRKTAIIEYKFVTTVYIIGHALIESNIHLDITIRRKYSLLCLGKRKCRCGQKSDNRKETNVFIHIKDSGY